MEPISALFASYLAMISGTFQDHVAEVTNSSLKQVAVVHQGQTVTYQHLVWRIHLNSVCSDHKQNLVDLSRCQSAAKSLFEETCHVLQEPKYDQGIGRNFRNMYCLAAVDFKPVVAGIGFSSGQTEAAAEKERCNLATTRAMGSLDRKILAERDEACSAFRKISGQ